MCGLPLTVLTGVCVERMFMKYAGAFIFLYVGYVPCDVKCEVVVKWMGRKSIYVLTYCKHLENTILPVAKGKCR